MAELFPIIRTVNEAGRDYKKRLDERDKVKCYYCQRPFELNRMTVYIDENSGMQIAKCPNPTCRKGVAVLYYFDKVVNRQKPLDNRLKRKKVQAA